MTRFYLMRHGDKESIMGEPPLTEKGQEEARKTAEYLRQFPIGAILASPTLRTQQTATAIAKALGLSIQTEPKLIERMNWGDDVSQTFGEFMKVWQQSTADRTWEPPIGVSSKTSGTNMEMVLHKHASDAEQIAVVGHGGIIADFLLNVFSAETLDAKFPNFSKIKEDVMMTCSITIVDLDPESGKFTLQQIAGVQHLS